MSLDIASIWNAVVDWMANGLWDLSWWQLLLYTLITTHFTIAGVTIYLHRSQAHRALDLGPIPSHFFRFWLWLGTGMVTKEWVAIHRKHHAKCETADDPHSPQTRGLGKVMREGAELYRAEAKNEETLRKYGHGTPDDWMERNIYRHSVMGPSLMLILNVALFGVIGLSIWAVQMVWIPFWAAGVVNGVGHFWGYRNYEATDASTNLVPWGLIIGGEELHNNHHTFPTSAKFSVKPYEFDIGWVYISLMQKLGWAKVKKTPPRLRMGAVKPVADELTLEAIIANRYEVMARYARGVRTAVQHELDLLKQKQAQKSDVSLLKGVQRWLHRDADKVPERAQSQLAQARAAHPVIDQMLVMREELRQLWLNTSLSREQLTGQLQAWCQRAEASGIAALKDFSVKLRAAHV
ncbi:fatty acid desaturase [Comamonas thiooxydans]|jgi:stearoyl-CoA desaturase (delta-9 desaturase)|uniref:Fatty acid desaturase n=1 Tax=Comamonas thiooxydans TaxID=363952 RepID=A0AA42TTC0_9BURK|nr:fatty acid desaturase [Comamonas thiooxydans]MDH1251653.1 fatty acid desaturase [Comamonas thiooxydans]MDH1333649.1 fatty acid desaturase [Comamonas thiooxydans]MDH1474001.1 fatty acid desaturase [Comamonas thiooxydans]MDH1739279.1 fatty acid desaturase [Comamonas thiooxydans]MDH1785706.1 fatty acid desaturase [Comamonas thiooxydans]